MHAMPFIGSVPDPDGLRLLSYGAGIPYRCIRDELRGMSQHIRVDITGLYAGPPHSAWAKLFGPSWRDLPDLSHRHGESIHVPGMP